nr:hypothetical protein [Tanacetum cinerariifolium]
MKKMNSGGTYSHISCILCKKRFAIISDSNPVFILKASILPKRKLDLTTGIYFLGYGLLYDHTKATAYVQQHSIRFKMDTKKNIVDLEAFREMLHISPRVLGQSFAELPFEEEILEFLSPRDHLQQLLQVPDWKKFWLRQSQVALDEALIPSAQRLRIGRSNF